MMPDSVVSRICTMSISSEKFVIPSQSYDVCDLQQVARGAGLVDPMRQGWGRVILHYGVVSTTCWYFLQAQASRDF